MEDNPKSIPTIGLLGQAIKIAVYICLGLFVLSFIGSLINTIRQWGNALTIFDQGKATPSITTPPDPFLTFTVTPSPLPTFTPSPTSTFTPFPTPAKGSDGPPGFFVGPWHDNYIACDILNRYWVDIYGVEIKGDSLTYKFIFFQFEISLREITSNEDYVVIIASGTDYVTFKEPIRVNKGSYVHVIIKFEMITGEEKTWKDDLFYPLINPICYEP